MSLATLVDQLILDTRIRDLAYFATGDRSERVARIAGIIDRLNPGHYLIGCGPHSTELIKVGSMELIVGRHSSMYEESADQVIDYNVNDASLSGPREVSRVHFTAVLGEVEGDPTILIRDERSSTGTWLLQGHQQVEPDEWTPLKPGQVISLGPSGVNLFLAHEVTSS